MLKLWDIPEGAIADEGILSFSLGWFFLFSITVAAVPRERLSAEAQAIDSPFSFHPVRFFFFSNVVFAIGEIQRLIDYRDRARVTRAS